ncbi:MAG: hypothetical protein B6D55_06120 [Candidatus Omnitrophica bacterium 4484_70.2]|nr:MAG: hypothetical protein B6D55_06120 [Candidatus Omnitrophica bacterium 4484_70.2]
MQDKLDILKEVGTIAAAYGSIALSEILGKKINLIAPSVELISSLNIEKKLSFEGMVISLQSQILSGIEGRIIFLLGEKDVYKLVNLYYKPIEEIKKGSVFTEMGISLIKEIGGVVISAYVSALGYFLKRLVIPSLPVFINAPLQDIIRIITTTYAQEEYVILIESVFEEVNEGIRGNFWLALTSQTVEDIQNTCQKILENLEK